VVETVNGCYKVEPVGRPAHPEPEKPFEEPDDCNPELGSLAQQSMPPWIPK
jgi:hypothetical protein